MKNKFLCMFLFLFFVANSIAQDDPAIKDLAWHRYVTNNFTILSLDDDQGVWMKNNLENIKVWCLTRWGLPDVKFSKECRVFCVPDNDMLNKLFSLDSSRVEIRKKDGNIEITAMWLALDDKPAKVLPSNLSQIILAEFEQVNSFKFPLWSIKGMSFLNSIISDVKSDIANINESYLLDIESVLNFNEEQYLKLNLENKKCFNSQAVILCLFLRKEFGEIKFHSFLKTSYKTGSKDAIEKVLGFKTISDFKNSYARYLKQLCKDVKEKTTPESYLIIKKAEN